MDWYEISEVKLNKNKYICFELFEVLILIFSLKEETMRKIPNPKVAELAHYIIVFNRQGTGTCFGNTEILAWHLFSLGILKPSLLHLI